MARFALVVALVAALPFALSASMTDPPLPPPSCLTTERGTGWYITRVDYRKPAAWLWRVRLWLFWLTR